jgi:hypothetical protein
MATTDIILLAFQHFDAANKQDPNTEIFEATTYPKEVLYGIRMTERLNEFAPNTSEALRLAARCQHICRWEIPRESYAMSREGYLRWRQDLKKHHARKATSILQEVGYPQETIDEVCFLLEKKQLKKNEETQTLEDVICLVFLEYYFEPFSLKHQEDKTVDILKKTWRKMSVNGQEVALKLPFSKFASELIFKALSQ